MGTKCAPNFANIFVASLEEEFLTQRLNARLPTPSLWLRYIDDILLIWEQDEDSLIQFINQLNDFNPSTQFTKDYSFNSTTFLDLEVFKGTKFAKYDQLDFKPYRKSCHKNSYLHFQSCHPCHYFSGIVRGEAIRMLCNSSDIEIYSAELDKLFNLFRERGYPRKVLRNAMEDLTYSARPGLVFKKRCRNYTIRAEDTFFKAPYHPGFKKSTIKTTLDTKDLPFNNKIILVPFISLHNYLVRAIIPEEDKEED